MANLSPARPGWRPLAWPPAALWWVCWRTGGGTRPPRPRRRGEPRRNRQWSLSGEAYPEPSGRVTARRPGTYVLIASLVF